jgi:hypothetical protein
VMPQGYKDSIATWYAALRDIGGADIARADLLHAAQACGSHEATR